MSNRNYMLLSFRTFFLIKRRGYHKIVDLWVSGKGVKEFWLLYLPHRIYHLIDKWNFNPWINFTSSASLLVLLITWSKRRRLGGTKMNPAWCLCFQCFVQSREGRTASLWSWHSEHSEGEEGESSGDDMPDYDKMRSQTVTSEIEHDECKYQGCDTA